MILILAVRHLCHQLHFLLTLVALFLLFVRDGTPLCGPIMVVVVVSIIRNADAVQEGCLTDQLQTFLLCEAELVGYTHLN